MGVKEAYLKMKKAYDIYYKIFKKYGNEVYLQIASGITQCMEIIEQECPEVKEGT